LFIIGFLGVPIFNDIYLPIRKSIGKQSNHTRLHITQSAISKQSISVLGTKTKSVAITPKTVVKLRQRTTTPPVLQEEERKTGEASPRITRIDILVGSEVIFLGLPEDNLTRSELYWLAQELSSWLNLPIIQR
jgi:hypothetical protein